MDSSPKRATRAKAGRPRTAPTASFMAGTRSTAAKRKSRSDEKDDEDLAKRDAAAKRPRGGAAIANKVSETDVAKTSATETAPVPGPAPATRKPATGTTTSKRQQPPAAPENAAAPRPTRGRPRKVAPASASEPSAATGRISRSASSSTIDKMAAKTTSATAATTTTTTTRTTATATTSRSTRPGTATTAPPPPTTTTTTIKTVTRGAAAATKTAPAAGPSRAPAKKAVKFREPDKENLIGSKESAATGLRGRPARRGGTAMTRATTRATSKAAASTTTSSTTGQIDKKPLSAIRMAQNFTKWEESDDELAKDKTPLKPLMKSPIKPPTAKNPVATAEEQQPDQQQSRPQLQSQSQSQSQLQPQVTRDMKIFGQLDANAFMLGSPVRPAHSPLANGLRSPAKRIASLGSALKPAATEQAVSQSPSKTSLLQSAAKRPKSPIKGMGLQPAQDPAIVAESASKLSMFQSPAKRAMPGLRSMAEPLSAGPSRFREFPALDPRIVHSAKPSEKLLHELDMGKGVEDGDDVFRGPIESLRFPGRSTRALSREEIDRILGMEVVEEEKDEVEASREEAVEQDEEEYAEEEQDVVDHETADGHDESRDGDSANTEGLLGDDDNERNGGYDVDVEQEEVAADDEISGEMENPAALEEATQDFGKPAESATREAAFVQETQDEQPQNAFYQLREKDQDPCHDMSTLTDLEDDNTMPIGGMATTPATTSRANATSRGIASCVARSGRRTTIGFSSLADQLDAWSAASPVKAPPTARKLRFAEPLHEVADAGADADAIADADPNVRAGVDQDEADHDGDSQMSDSFLEEEAAEPVPADESDEPDTQDTEEKDEPIIFNDMSFTDEDQALALEANEMSLSDVTSRRSFDDNLSDASQEYADENQVPPEHVATNVENAPQAAATPVRPLTSTFHTTTKIPLKPSDDSTPSPIKKRSYSAPRAAPKRSGGLSSKVTSLIPNITQERRRSPRKQVVIAEEETAPETPSQTAGGIESWSAAETPGRTPRKDVNPNLLRGAIVFVDVHTSEGADASGIFVELLTQMGARCVKSWNWNPSEGSASSKKVGITHVVFKDGSRRTLEKVREANGVVQCVGVGWVLNCEHANEWLDEAHYCIDTSSVPRGGGRRRKSMEPRSVANGNGGAVSGSPGRSGRDSLGGAPSTPRRQSTMWMASFADPDSEGADGDDIEGSSTFLTPVPKTPAPEAIARFAAEGPSNGYGDDDDDDEGDDTVSPLKNELLMRTCPARSRFREAGGGGGGILNLHQSLTQDEDVRVRLMAARRKSLQFAPKVGSPLAKMWR